MAKTFGAYVHLKVAETQAELQRMINTSFANTKLILSDIEFSPAAVEHLQSQLQTMLTQIGQNLNIDASLAGVGTGSSVGAEQSASAAERAANAAERRAAADSASAQSAAENATAEQRAASASEQRLRYNEQNNTIYAETADLSQAETSRLSDQLRLLNQIVQMRIQLLSMISHGVVSSDNADAQTLLNTLNALQTRITSNLSPTRAELIDITAQVSAAQVAMRSFNEELVRSGNIGSATVQTERFNMLEKKLITLRTQIQRTLNANSNLNGTNTGAAMQSLIGQIDQYLSRLRSMGVISDETYREMNAQIGTMGVNFQSLKGNMVEFGETGNNVITRLTSGFQKFGGWMVVTRVLTSIIRLFRQMVTNVKEIDAAMTQLKIVTKATSAEMSRFSSSVADTAVKIGASISDLTELATTYARLGYTLNESETLAKYTSMLTKVGNIDTSDAEDAVTAITKAFDIDASRIEAVMDKLVAVGNNFPISTSEIAEGMNNASSALAAAGNTFEQSIALLTAANTTVQDISKASTGLRTITARLRNTTVDLEELGEEMTQPKYEELVSTLTDAGVALRDMNGEYRSTYDIMSDLAAKWSSLDSMRQSALATAIAGNRMQNVFYSLIASFDEASGAMNTMSKSTGELEESYAVAVDSIEGRTNQLNAAFQKFSTTVVNSSLVKSLVQALTGLVSVLQSILTFGDGILPKLVLSIATGRVLLAVLNKIVAAVISFKISVTSAGTAVGALGNGIKALSNYSVMIFLTALVGIITELGKASERAAKYLGRSAETAAKEEKSLDDLANEYKNTQSEIESLNTQLSDTNAKISALLAKGSLSVIEAAELSRLQATNSELERTLTLKKKILTGQQLETANKFTEAMQNYGDEIEEDTDAWTKHWDAVYAGYKFLTSKEGTQERQDAYYLASRAHDNGWGDSGRFEGTDKLYFAMNRYERAANDRDYQIIVEELGKLEDAKKSLEGIDYSLLPKDAKEQLTKIEQFEARFVSLTGTAQETADTIASSSHLASANELLLSQAQSNELTVDTLQNLASENDVVQQLISEYKEYLGLTSDDEAMQGIVEHYNAAVQEATTSTETAAQAYETMKEELSAMRSAFSTVSSAISEFNEKGTLTSETISNLLSLDNKYLNLLVDEQGQLSLTSDSYEKLIKAKMTDMLLSQMQTTFDNILTLSAEEAAAYAAAEAYDAEAASIVDLIKAKMKLSLQDAAEKDAENNTDAYSKAVIRAAESYTPLVEAIDNWSIEMEGASGVTDEATEALNDQKSALENTKEALEAQKDALEDQKEALEDAKDALEDYKDELSDAQSSIRDLIDTVIDYIKHEKEAEKTALEEKKDKAREAIEKRKEAFDDLIEAEKEELQVKKDAADFERTLKEKQNSVAKNALAASIASLDDSSAGRKASKEANDALVSSRDDLYAELADRAYDLEVERLDKLKEIRDEAYDKEIEESDARYDAQIDKLDAYLSDVRQIYNDACALIENDTGNLYSVLWDYTYNNTTKTKAEFDDMWSKAKTALDKYGVAQLGVVGVMEYLQGEIYITEQKISNLDGQIDNLSTSIDGVSTAIDGVETSLGKVETKLNNMSNTTMSTFTTKINDIRDAYKKMIEEMQAEVQNAQNQSNKKWHFQWDGIDFWSTATDQTKALQDIMAQLRGRWGWDDRAGGFVRNSMKYYAKGTFGAAGGPSYVNEEGHEIRVLNKGDGILTAKITKNLSNLGSNPVQFLADAGKELLSKISGSTILGNLTNYAPALAAVGSSGDMPITIVNHISGDVNPSTLKALEKAQKQITDNAINGIMKKTLGLRSSGRFG